MARIAGVDLPREKEWRLVLPIYMVSAEACPKNSHSHEHRL